MRKLLVMIGLGVALLALAPAAEAQWRDGHRGGHGGFGVRASPRVFFGFGGYPYWGGGYYGGYYGYPYYPYPYAYSPPVVYAAPPPAVYVAPPPASAPTAPAPEIQREVIYPHGKYVLEGDGMSTAYRWTWIPSPTAPPPPPPADPPRQ